MKNSNYIKAAKLALEKINEAAKPATNETAEERAEKAFIKKRTKWSDSAVDAFADWLGGSYGSNKEFIKFIDSFENFRSEEAANKAYDVDDDYLRKNTVVLDYDDGVLVQEF